MHLIIYVHADLEWNHKATNCTACGRTGGCARVASLAVWARPGVAGGRGAVIIPGPIRPQPLLPAAGRIARIRSSHPAGATPLIAALAPGQCLCFLSAVYCRGLLCENHIAFACTSLAHLHV